MVTAFCHIRYGVDFPQVYYLFRYHIQISEEVECGKPNGDKHMVENVMNKTNVCVLMESEFLQLSYLPIVRTWKLVKMSTMETLSTASEFFTVPVYKVLSLNFSGKAISQIIKNRQNWKLINGANLKHIGFVPFCVTTHNRVCSMFILE
jgi:hypothetical protein